MVLVDLTEIFSEDVRSQRLIIPSFAQALEEHPTHMEIDLEVCCITHLLEFQIILQLTSLIRHF